MRRRRPELIGAAAASLAFLAGCGQGGPIEKPPSPVRVQTVAPAPVGGGVRYSASIAPREQVNLAFKVSGYIREILQVPGVDIFYLGPADYSATAGFAGQWEGPGVAEVSRVVRRDTADIHRRDAGSRL